MHSIGTSLTIKVNWDLHRLQTVFIFTLRAVFLVVMVKMCKALFSFLSSVKTYAIRAECWRSCQWQKSEGLFTILSKTLIISWWIISQTFDVLLISAFLSDFHRKMQNPLHASQSKMKFHLALKLWAGAESRLRPDHSSRSLWPWLMHAVPSWF